jgi:preprotein translocase subunit SecF
MFAIKYRKIFLTIAVLVMIACAGIVFKFGLNFGIDFTGGALTEVAYNQLPDKTELESSINQLDLGAYSLREATDEAGRPAYILRTRDLNETERLAVEATVLGEYDGAELSRFTSIGPVIGQELKDKAIWAIAGVIFVIIIYVAIAFAGVGKPVGSFVYGGITIFALIHDVLVPTALMSILGAFAGVEVDILFVMALLAVLGYSVNDTIVVFDRVRENLVKYRVEKRTKRNEAGIIKEDVSYTLTKPFSEIVGMSVSQTLLRSINTSVTTLIALTTLYFLGGEVTKTFSLILIAGVLAGTYSSIFLANPLLVYIASRSADKENEQT